MAECYRGGVHPGFRGSGADGREAQAEVAQVAEAWIAQAPEPGSPDAEVEAIASHLSDVDQAGEAQ